MSVSNFSDEKMSIPSYSKDSNMPYMEVYTDEVDGIVEIRVEDGFVRVVNGTSEMILKFDVLNIATMKDKIVPNSEVREAVAKMPDGDLLIKRLKMLHGSLSPRLIKGVREAKLSEFSDRFLLSAPDGRWMGVFETEIDARRWARDRDVRIEN